MIPMHKDSQRSMTDWNGSIKAQAPESRNSLVPPRSGWSSAVFPSLLTSLPSLYFPPSLPPLQVSAAVSPQWIICTRIPSLALLWRNTASDVGPWQVKLASSRVHGAHCERDLITAHEDHEPEYRKVGGILNNHHYPWIFHTVELAKVFHMYLRWASSSFWGGHTEGQRDQTWPIQIHRKYMVAIASINCLNTMADTVGWLTHYANQLASLPLVDRLESAVHTFPESLAPTGIHVSCLWSMKWNLVGRAFLPE